MDFNIGHVNEKDRTSPERFKDIYKQREQIIGIEKCFPKTGPRTIYRALERLWFLEVGLGC